MAGAKLPQTAARDVEAQTPSVPAHEAVGIGKALSVIATTIMGTGIPSIFALEILSGQVQPYDPSGSLASMVVFSLLFSIMGLLLGDKHTAVAKVMLYMCINSALAAVMLVVLHFLSLISIGVVSVLWAAIICFSIYDSCSQPFRYMKEKMTWAKNSDKSVAAGETQNRTAQQMKPEKEIDVYVINVSGDLRSEIS